MANVNAQQLGNALKDSLTESEKTSKTIGDIRKDSLTNTTSESGSHGRTADTVYSVSESNGFVANANMEREFIEKMAADPRYQTISGTDHTTAHQERIAAASNDLAKMDRKEAAKLYESFLNDTIKGDEKFTTFGQQMATRAGQIQAEEKQGQTRASNVVAPGQKNVTGPGAGPTIGKVKKEVESGNAGTAGVINGGAVTVNEAQGKPGIFNSHPVQPDDYKPADVHPAAGPGALSAPVEPAGVSKPTDFAKTIEVIQSAGAAAANTTPGKIVTGVAGAGPQIVNGLENLNPGAVSSGEPPRLEGGQKNVTGPGAGVEKGGPKL